MAKITIDIPDAVKDRVLNAISKAKGYHEMVDDPVNSEEMIANPQSKAEFVKNHLVEYIKGLVKYQEGRSVAIAARQAAETKVDNEVNIT